MTEATPCGLARRFAAIAYDGIVLIAVLFFAAIPPTVAVVSLASVVQEASVAFRLGMGVYVLAVAFAFYGGFWTHGGQTIGMRAWRVRVVRADGGPVRWADAGLRFTAAMLSWTIFGAGFWWSLLDHERRTWHDCLSRTRLVHTG